ncbi:hypothetical protein PG988_010314 [Apiospora saccharicola]
MRRMLPRWSKNMCNKTLNLSSVPLSSAPRKTTTLPHRRLLPPTATYTPMDDVEEDETNASDKMSLSSSPKKKEAEAASLEKMIVDDQEKSDQQPVRPSDSTQLEHIHSEVEQALLSLCIARHPSSFWTCHLPYSTPVPQQLSETRMSNLH